ncbi:MAG: tetratricopeptide repeat protein [Alphaproteobacteria bacterium]|nr:tetratricopeptide repeat protein [Alphaproteobacteria bacterium]MDE2111103.1 tetratricopeptide repeat protein [Alphaproteobacteria bacterium]MDE2494803.1 tetratricopeptide repeat protein [Alphaproteobacteria bacterium]
MRLAAFLFAVLLPAAAWAAPPKPMPKPVDALFTQLHAAQSPEEAKSIEEQILALFQQSGSASIDLLMARATAAQAAGDKDTARQILQAVTSLAPKYAEGWHSLGLLQSDAGQDENAMVSLQKTVALNPREFQAMEQLGEMLEEYGDKPGALKMFRAALALDPQYEGLARHVTALERDVEGQGI